MPNNFDAVFAICSMCVPLAVLAESYAQMFVIFNKFYRSVIKYQLRKSIKIFKSK